MKIFATEYMSLDGSFSEPGKWSFPFWSDAAAQFKFDELRSTDAGLFGRRTYEAFAAVWPTMTDQGEFADLMNNMRKYVVSKTIEKAEWGETTVIREDVIAAVRKLKESGEGNIMIAGSGTLVRGLTEARLIDEYRIMLYPVVLGFGPYLFPEGSPRTDLQLADTLPLPNGVTVLTYLPKPGD